jgi:hypothetical protein
MSSFWAGFEKRAAEVMDDTSFSQTPITPRQTTFMTDMGTASKKRSSEHIKYEDNYSTTGAFGY